jgi:hypothetical protein
MAHEAVIAALRKIAEARLAALKEKVESQLKDLESPEPVAPDLAGGDEAWQGTAKAILTELAAGADPDLGCCTYHINGKQFMFTMTADECSQIPSDPPSSFDPTPCP